MKLELKLYHVIVLLLLIHLYRKLRISNEALRFLNENKRQVDISAFRSNAQLAKALASIDVSPGVMMLNKHALNVTLNWLCNVVNFEGIHKRLIMIAFDNETYDTLTTAWPDLHVVHWRFPVMERRFIAGDGRYQMFQLFRSNLCAYIASTGRDFWMIQPDTYWRENLFDVVDPNELLSEDENMLFDQEGSEGLLADMIAGGCYYVKANQRSVLFFNELSRRLLTYYATDNNIMGALCSYNFAGNKCSFIPYRIVSNWRWHSGDKRHMPSLMQFDGGAGCESKLEQMQRLGAAFVIPDTLGDQLQPQCNHSLTREPKNAIPRSALMTDSVKEWSVGVGQVSIRLVHGLCEWLYAAFPSFGRFLRGTLFPHYAYYVVI